METNQVIAALLGTFLLFASNFIAYRIGSLVQGIKERKKSLKAFISTVDVLNEGFEEAGISNKQLNLIHKRIKKSYEEKISE